MTKSQKQLVLLGVLVAAIIGVLVYISSGSEKLVEQPYVAKDVDVDVPVTVFDNPEFKILRSPVSLPVTYGDTGRENPFDPY